MRPRRRALLAWAALPGWAAAADASPTWALEARWVTWVVPAGAGEVARGPSWSTRRPTDAIEPWGPRLRLSVGAEAAWTVSRPAGTLAWVRAGRVGLPLPLPATDAAAATPTQRLWVRLEATRTERDADGLGPTLSARVALRWEGSAGEGGSEAWQSTLWLPASRWTPVLRHDEPTPAPAAPGELRSADAAPRRSRELQVRLSPLPP